ncbi:unnamed protein product [Acanthosepion pharaonis]|uniref:Endonuclease/exonuclease/phosphatase domain-containing protein n=1 Tax=Acanthosepion pharaonis TaxID=158019 RepID=A0A812DDH2_ACAPH|nr:unnamed protein product [Sepia pharaonis]
MLATGILSFLFLFFSFLSFADFHLHHHHPSPVAIAPRATWAGLERWKPSARDCTQAVGQKRSLSGDIVVTPEFGSWTRDWTGLLRTTAAYPTWKDVANTTRPERCTALVCKELARFNIDVAALSETRLPEEGNTREAGTGYTIFRKWKAPEEPHIHGVGFAIRSQLVQQHNLAPTAISERLMTVRLPIMRGRHITLISVYAPTLNSPDEDKAAFYTQLDHTIQRATANDKLIVLGEFNARVGMDHHLWEGVIGHHEKPANATLQTHRSSLCGAPLDHPQRRHDPCSGESIGYSIKKRQQWFDESYGLISPVIETKHQTRLTRENQPTATNKRAHKQTVANCQRGIREAQNTWWQRKAAERQSYDDQRDLRIGGLKDVDGATTITESEGILARGRSHFESLHNAQVNTRDNLLRMTPQHSVRHWMALPPDIHDFNKTLKRMRPGKAPDPDNIPLDLLTHSGPEMRNCLMLLILKIWETKTLLRDFRDATV